MKNEKNNLVDTIFPREDSENTKSTSRKNLKTVAQISPFVALLCMLIMMWGFGIVGIIVGVLCGVSLIGIIITSVIMKKSGRDPSSLLVLSGVKPLMVVLGLCLVVGTLAYFGRPEYISVQNAYKKNHPGQDFPNAEFFGFVVGETSFEEAIEIFKAAGATYKVEDFENTEIKSLKSNDYTGREIPLRHVSLEFDKDGKIYSILAWMNSKKLSQKELYDVNRAFHYKYKRINSSPFNPEDYQRYWTQSGVEIWVQPDERAPTIKITNLPEERETECFRNKARLLAEKKAADKYLSEDVSL